MIYQPILDLSEAILQNNTEKINKLLDAFGLTLTLAEKELKDDKLFNSIMKPFMPLGDALMDGIVNHLPNPKKHKNTDTLLYLMVR